MMDPAMLDWDDLGLLAGIYSHGQFLHGPVDTLTPARKKKFRNWVTKLYQNEISELSQDAQAYFDQEISDDALLKFLEECHEEMERCMDRRRKDFVDATGTLDEDTRMALLAIYDATELPPVEREGDHCVLLIDDTSVFKRKLVLKNVEGICEYVPGGYMMDVPKLERTLERYIFSTDIDGEAAAAVFSQAETHVECYNCLDSLIYWDDPWSYLRQLADEICYKMEATKGYCNDLELKLLPLLQEIRHLNGVWLDEIRFVELKALAGGLGFEKISQLLAKLERIQRKKRLPECKKIKALLCRQEYEPLWRAIFEQISRSQVGYPLATEVCCDGELLKKKRSAVQKIMKSHGFTGTYPNYEKRGPIPGLHLENSYGQSYFIAGEKDAASHIRCLEGCDSEGKPVIQFLCGTQFLRKDEQPGDIYSCLFAAKGHRLYWWARDYRLLGAPAEDPNLDKMLAQIAAKRARLQRMSPQEKKLYHNGSESGWGLFLWFLLLGGGIFGVLMTLGMLVMCVVLIGLLDGFHEVPQLLRSVPWGYILLFSWLCFGFSMGVITVLAAKK